MSEKWICEMCKIIGTEKTECDELIQKAIQQDMGSLMEIFFFKLEPRLYKGVRAHELPRYDQLKVTKSPDMLLDAGIDALIKTGKWREGKTVEKMVEDVLCESAKELLK